MVPLTATQWESFTPKQKWDVIVALRGPDTHNSETMKWFTTAVIRGKMRKVMRVGGMVNPDLNLIIIPSGSINGIEPPYPKEKKEFEPYPGEAKITRKVPIIPEPATTTYALWREATLVYLRNRRTWSEGHFFQHVMEAAEILYIPIATVEGETYRKIVGHYHRKAAEKFAACLPDEADELKRHIMMIDASGGY